MADAPAIVIAGATATGKTAVAIELARRIGGEIVSMDSRQVYRGLDIGTAKPAPAERGGIAHHGFDIVDPDERYSAGRFARDARAWIAGIRGRGRVPILAGGTGFFLRALTRPMFREPELPLARREALKRWLATQDAARVRRIAAVHDPRATRLPDDRQRLARIAEVGLLTGRPLSWWQRHAPPEAAPVPTRIVVLELPRAALDAAIDARVARMMEVGLLDEVRRLRASGYGRNAPGMNATGYIELLDHLEHGEPLETAVERIRHNTRRYARRQATWLRHQLPGDAVRVDAGATASELAGLILERLEAMEAA
jgi:tRNA dimethylallyltransferase